ncbi:MAG: DUF504 domain-containing protein, partial [Nanoarchaeota archaeon]|nr:DUF504 domain-containing protein [Nanoarchaeota archaeon]
KKSFFVYKASEETTIPMHRVLRVIQDGKVIWKKPE